MGLPFFHVISHVLPLGWERSYFQSPWTAHCNLGATVLSKGMFALQKAHSYIDIYHYSLASGHKPYSGRISVMSYTVSGGLLEAKVNQVKPCFNII